MDAAAQEVDRDLISNFENRVEISHSRRAKVRYFCHSQPICSSHGRSP